MYIDSDGDLFWYDYQQDGGIDATGENCYDTRAYTLFPRGGDNYSIDGLNVILTRNGESLTIAFSYEDYLDLDSGGDTTETPTLTLTAITSPGREDFNECEFIGEPPYYAVDAPKRPFEEPLTYREPMTRAECDSEGGSVIEDVGDGALYSDEYRCESGLRIAANIINNRQDGGGIVGGQFCCL